MIGRIYNHLNAAVKRPENRKWIYAFVLGLSGLFIALIVIKNWSQLSLQQWRFNPVFLVLTLLAFPLGMLPTVAAWHFILRSFGVRQPFLVNLRIYSLSALPRHIPGMIAYISSRSLMYQEKNVPLPLVLSATIAEAVLQPLTGFVVSLVLLLGLADYLLENPGFRIAIILSVAVLFVIVLLTPGLKSFLARISRGRITAFPTFERKYLLATVFWMAIAWAGGGLTLFFLINSIWPLPWSTIPALIGVWGASGAVSMSIGALIQGLGIREVTMTALLSLIISPLAAVTVAVGFRLAFILAELIWVLIFVRISGFRQPLSVEEKPT